jgi:hypothetical protein
MHSRPHLYVFSLLIGLLEKLISTPAVLTGKLSKMANNELIIGNVYSDHTYASKPSKVVLGTIPFAALIVCEATSATAN